ncbi:MAG: hypothetical protein JWR07_1432 [Nevskia sp.]|nr:hypothetical protein [Nevskia sp.]
MFEPITLTVAELADRWNRTPRQILESAIHRGLPPYFSFDGLVFNIGDEWLRSNGDWQQTRNRDERPMNIIWRLEVQLPAKAFGQFSVLRTI